jgi:hypothetical protein
MSIVAPVGNGQHAYVLLSIGNSETRAENNEAIWANAPFMFQLRYNSHAGPQNKYVRYMLSLYI